MEIKFFILILFATNFLSFSALEMLDVPPSRRVLIYLWAGSGVPQEKYFHVDIILLPLYYNKLPGTFLFLKLSTFQFWRILGLEHYGRHS